MKPLERLLLAYVVIVVTAALIGGYVAATDYVVPAWERFQQAQKQIEKIEEIINKLPVRPFREEGGEAFRRIKAADDAWNREADKRLREWRASRNIRRMG
jgi:uncharacterized membrane protein (DUF106 family)